MKSKGLLLFVIALVNLKEVNMTHTLISADNVWALWAIIIGWAAVSIWLEQKYKWASKISGAIIALLGTLILSNIGVIPQESSVYDAVWDYVVPMSIPLMLFSSNLKKIWREAGKTVVIFIISAFGTVLGAVAAHLSLAGIIGEESAAVATTMTGSYTGGPGNFAAMADMTSLSGGTTSALVVADNLLMGLLFVTLIAIPNMKFFRKHFRHPHIDELEMNGGEINVEETGAANYWKRQEVSLKDIALAMGTAVVICAVGNAIATFFGETITADGGAMAIVATLLSNKYLMITTLTVLVTTFMPNYCESLHGSQDIGFFFIYLFLTVIGVPASIPLIIQQAPILLVYCAIMVIVNLLVTLVFGKLLKFSIEECVIASNANIGGAATAMAYTISKGWKNMIVPAMMVGVLGYIVGNYFGAIVWAVIG